MPGGRDPPPSQEQAGAKGNFAYHANSNLVLQADRRGRRPATGADGAPIDTGEASSLWGKVDKGMMGDRAAIAKSVEVEGVPKLASAAAKSTGLRSKGASSR
jgi:hypothetical protein